MDDLGISGDQFQDFDVTQLFSDWHFFVHELHQFGRSLILLKMHEGEIEPFHIERKLSFELRNPSERYRISARGEKDVALWPLIKASYKRRQKACLGG